MKSLTEYKRIHRWWVKPRTRIVVASGVLTFALGLTLYDAHCGSVVAWGFNTPGVPTGLGDVVQVSVGTSHILALRRDGSVTAWGKDDQRVGLTTVPENLHGVQKVSAGRFHNLALLSDGSISAWGAGKDKSTAYPNAGQSRIPENLPPVKEIAAGGFHSVVLLEDGRVQAWGDGFSLVNMPPVTDAVAVAAGDRTCLALRRDGTVVAGGIEYYSRPPSGIQWLYTKVPAGLNGVKAIASGYNHSLALKIDSTVVAWGMNEYGQTNTPAGLSNVVAVAAGWGFSFALKSDGRIVTWGGDTNAIPPADTFGALSISAGSGGHAAAVVEKRLGLIPAKVSPTVVNGFVVAVSVVDPGAGYANVPAIHISGGGGSGASAVAVIRSGAVISVNVLNAGSGYTSIPTITVDPPAHRPPSLSVTVSRVRVEMSVVPGFTYSLESSPDLRNWSVVNAALRPVTEVVSQEFESTEALRYFRLRENP